MLDQFKEYHLIEALAVYVVSDPTVLVVISNVSWGHTHQTDTAVTTLDIRTGNEFLAALELFTVLYSIRETQHCSR